MQSFGYKRGFNVYQLSSPDTTLFFVSALMVWLICVCFIVLFEIHLIRTDQGRAGAFYGTTAIEPLFISVGTVAP